MTRDSLGDRMKDYEGVPRTSLVRRVPVMMRLDGKAFGVSRENVGSIVRGERWRHV
jgi:hypothetical protein